MESWEEKIIMIVCFLVVIVGIIIFISSEPPMTYYEGITLDNVVVELVEINNYKGSFNGKTQDGTVYQLKQYKRKEK